jgi:hypothetical protein
MRNAVREPFQFADGLAKFNGSFRDHSLQFEGVPPDLILGAQQRLLCPPALGDVHENHGDFAAFQPTEPKSIDIEPPVQRLGFIHEADRFAGQGNLAIGFIPMGFMVRSDFAHPFSHRTVHSGLMFERRVHFQKPVIDGLVVFIKQHFDDAKAFINRTKQGSILFLALAQRLLGLFPRRDIADVALDDFMAILLIEIADELNFVALARFGLQRQIFVANKVFLLQFAKSRSAGFFILEQTDFPKFFAQQFAMRVAQ